MKKLRIISIFFITIILASVTISPVNQVFAVNEFYSSNDILFYDGNASNCLAGGSTILIGNDNLEKILRYYVGQGLTLIQASGIAGNYQQESGFNPASVQPSKIADDNYKMVDGVGFGIAQWTWTARQAPLATFALSQNKKITDLLLQLDYSWQELSGLYSNSLTNLKATTTPDDAAYVFHRDFEQSNDTEATVKAVRGGNAVIIYNTFKDSISDGTSATTISASGCSGNGAPSQYIDGFAIYNQFDPQWANKPFGSSTIGDSGCGPSAMAMIITALTGRIVTPADTAEYGTQIGSYVPGEGSSWSIAKNFAEHWGLKATNIPGNVADINTALRAGGLIVTSGSGVSPFTTGGHYITIRAVTANGTWLIGDSNGQGGIANSSKEWDPTSLINNGLKKNNVWVISK